MRAPEGWPLWLLLGLGPAVATAHEPSNSFLVFSLDTQPPGLRWDIAVRDLEYAIGLDADRDGAINWGELRARHAAIARYALAHLRIEAPSGACRLTPGSQQLDRHGDAAYTALPVELDCPPGAPLRVHYGLFFDLDPWHRGLVRVAGPGGESSGMLSPERPGLALGVAAARATLTEYWREGVWHIWAGFDHLLFLLALLLPSVLWRREGRWHPVESLGAALRDVVAVVTAFTLAHSVTLGLAVLGWVTLPSRWVESAIAATVLLAALNNLYPLVPGRRWALAFLLGLVHGLGFASALAHLGLPGGALAPALLGFNLGVETGQIAIVALFVPIAFALRETGFYRRAALGIGSASVAALAIGWLARRGLGLDFGLPAL